MKKNTEVNNKTLKTLLLLFIFKSIQGLEIEPVGGPGFYAQPSKEKTLLKGELNWPIS